MVHCDYLFTCALGYSYLLSYLLTYKEKEGDDSHIVIVSIKGVPENNLHSPSWVVGS